MLPRVVDILKGAQDMWRHRGEAADNADFQVELVRCVWDDPYNQLGAATAEQEHCLALHPNGESIILFKTVLYGFEATPLILGRLSATVGRMWQAFLDDHQGAVQAHMEEQLVMIQGPKKTRDTLVALLVYTARVLGLNLSYERGSRGSRTKLMGMNLAVDLKAKEVVIDFPKEMIMQLVEYLRWWKERIPVRELRSVVGKLSVLAGVIPRIKWMETNCFKVMVNAEEEMSIEREQGLSSGHS